MAKGVFIRRSLLARMAVFAALAASAVGVHAKGLLGEEDDEEAVKPAKEWTVTLPGYPKPENLLPFMTERTASFTFAIDSKSLAVNADEVRYTVVATSDAGARNISYEGIACAGLKVSHYAFGYDGKWMQPQRAKWAPIDTRNPNRPQATLAYSFMCNQGSAAGKPEEILERIRSNRPLAQNNYKPINFGF